METTLRPKFIYTPRPPKVSKPPSARPFFNQTSIVLDFYKGHLGAAIERVTDADLSFVMYYAPWDAESQAVRQEFEAVARFHHKQVIICFILHLNIIKLNFYQISDIFCRHKLLASRIRVSDSVQQDSQLSCSDALP